MSNDLDTMKPVIAASIQPEQMDRHAIMSRALRHGFTLRPQEGRDDDLNEYVYSFARDVFEAGRKAASIEKKGVNQFQLRIILRAVQEFEISVGRAAECIEMLEAGRFSVADLPEVSEAFGFDDAPMEKYAELRAERDALAAKLAKIEACSTPDDAKETIFDFREGQWWVQELDAIQVASGTTPDQKRAIAVVHNLLRKVRELEGQEPVAWMNAKRDMTYLSNFHADDLPLYARPIPTEPVNARLLDALKKAEASLSDIGDADHEPSDDLAWCEQRAAAILPSVRAAIAAAEAQGVTGPKRLTDEEICQIAANSRSVEVERFLPVQFARAIEAAVLGVQEAKNGD